MKDTRKHPHQQFMVYCKDNKDIQEAYDLLLALGYSTYSEESLPMWLKAGKPINLKTNVFNSYPCKVDWDEDLEHNTKPLKTLDELYIDVYGDDMLNLINGKDALIAKLQDKDVQYWSSSEYGSKWCDVGDVDSFDLDEWLNERSNVNPVSFKFRLKPKTILINGVEVPAPFKPEIGDTYWYLHQNTTGGFAEAIYDNDVIDSRLTQYGAWKTEEEIIKVAEAMKGLYKNVN